MSEYQIFLAKLKISKFLQNPFIDTYKEKNNNLKQEIEILKNANVEELEDEEEEM
ncbi:MAG: hypothetical protein J6K42_00635 [Clostridia bacterium]|nr:hypothetical protein [Clostridia bacterium]